MEAPEQRRAATDNRTQGAQPQEVTMEPASVMLPAAGGVSIHQLRNYSRKRLAFKIKTSDNEHYRLSQVYGFIEGGSSALIEIGRLEGPPRTDTMLILLLEVSAQATDPRAPFTEGLPPLLKLRVPMTANR